MNERGKYLWPDGRKYEGGYSQDKKHGFGIYTWNDGRKYEGFWLNGKQNGKAMYIVPEGTVKIGEWVDGKRTCWLEDKDIDRPSNWTDFKYENKELVLSTLQKFKFAKYLPEILQKLER